MDNIDISVPLLDRTVARITKRGFGAGMMSRANETIRLVQSVVESLEVPVTVKMRPGCSSLMFRPRKILAL